MLDFMDFRDAGEVDRSEKNVIESVRYDLISDYNNCNLGKARSVTVTLN